MAALAEAHQRKAEQDREQQDLEDFALREGADHRIGNDVQEEVDRLLRFGLLGVAGDRLRVRHAAAEARAGPDQIADEQTDHQREGGDDLEIDQRLDADAADLLGILYMRDAGYHGAEDDRRDHHLDQLDEAVAKRLDPVVGRKRRPQPAEQRAEHDGDQDLNIENPVPGLCRTHRCFSRYRCRHDAYSPQRSRTGRACANPSHTAKILWASGVNGVGRTRPLSRRGSKIRRIAGTRAAPSAFLINDAAMNGAMPTSHAFSTPSFMPNASQAKSGGENENVSERHRDEQPEHRSVPAALAQPSRHEGRRHEAEEISGRRTDQRRKAADRTCEYRKSHGPLGQIGHECNAAEPPAVGRADHQHDQRLQRHRHVGQRQIDLGRQGQQRRPQRDQDYAAQQTRRSIGTMRPQQGGEREMRRRNGFRHGSGGHGWLPD